MLSDNASIYCILLIDWMGCLIIWVDLFFLAFLFVYGDRTSCLLRASFLYENLLCIVMKMAAAPGTYCTQLAQILGSLKG
jgi:hypothetical protein